MLQTCNQCIRTSIYSFFCNAFIKKATTGQQAEVFNAAWRTYSNLSYIHNPGKEPLKATTIGKLFEATTKTFPDREAIVSVQQNQRLTYQETLNQADKFAAGLQTLGLQKGDKVGIWAPNIVEWMITALACARAGFLLVALNPANQAGEMEYCINKVGVQALVCPDKVKKLAFYNILEELSKNLKDCEPGRLNSGNIPSLKSVIIISDKTLKGTYNYNEVLDLAEKNTIKNIQANQDLIQPDEPFNVQFTSGTTGKPKAAVITHFKIVNNSFNIAKRQELDKKYHRICVQNPFFHGFGLTITSMAAFNFGATLVLPSPVYSPSQNLKAIEIEKCSMIHGTPTMYVDLINHQKQNQANINPEAAITGGAPCSPKLFRQMQEILKIKRVKSVYGLTEVTAMVFHSQANNEDEYKVTATVGHVADHVEAKVVDEKGNMVPFGTPGELWVRGYSVMLGYWGDEDKTTEVLGADGWFKTGDQFVLQEDGYARIVGRLKDMLIRGGENIFPKEIEDFLNTHPDILESHVIGLNHERLGEEVCACVRLRKDAKMTHASLVKFCEGKLAHFKIPSQLKIVDSFPKTLSGKIQKYLLREQYENK